MLSTITDKMIATLGGFVAILSVALSSEALLGVQQAPLVVASMGASAVLLFALPHGILSQPWALVGGHMLSALVGVSCAQWLGESALASAAAVAGAIAVMHLAHCLHPPGGATALTAVIGGEQIRALGYHYLLVPVLVNVLVLLLVAILFNAPFARRRYPLFWFWG